MTVDSHSDRERNAAASLGAVMADVSGLARGVSAQQMVGLADAIQAAQAVFVVGQGRSGLVAQAFAMRLMQLGFHAHVVGEATAPGIRPEDLLIAISASGTTLTTVRVAEAAAGHGARVFAVIGEADSQLGHLASAMLVIGLPAGGSCQPGSTAFEQAAVLVLDAVVLELMARGGVTEDALLARHANLE